MLPDKWDWKRFTSIEKATYLAHVLAPVSLLVTTVFSFLAWQEARHAQELARQLFFSQNAPNVSVTRLELVAADAANPPTLSTVLTNVGGSDATNICFKFVEAPLGEPIWQFCRGEIYLGADESFSHVLYFDDGPVPEIFTGELHVFNANEPRPCGQLPPRTLFVEIAFEDELEGRRSNTEEIIACPRVP